MSHSKISEWIATNRARVLAFVVGFAIALPFLGGATYHVFRESPACGQRAEAPHDQREAVTFQSQEHGGYQLEYKPASEHEPEACAGGHTPEEWIALLTAYLVGFTAALATATLLLWWETRKALAGAHADSERQAQEFKDQLVVARDAASAAQAANRAWISRNNFEPVIATGGKRNGEPFEGYYFGVSWRNTGVTPALNCRVWGSFYIIAKELLPPDYVFEKVESLLNIAGPVAPGGVISAHPCAISHDEIRDVRRGKLRVLFWGRAEYEDVLDQKPRHWEFCMELKVGGDRLDEAGIVLGPNFKYTPFGTAQNTAS
jgi:hypothetical protein